MNTLDVIVGGQYGSESKGRVTADLAQRRAATGNAVYGVRVAGPNAGHVVISMNGTRYALRQLPVSLVSVESSVAVIAAGSEIDLSVLLDEIKLLEGDGIDVRSRLLVDRQATILEHGHRVAEGGNDGPMQQRIGSTGKGIGAARADRIWRKAAIAKDISWFEREGIHLADTATVLGKALDTRGHSVLIEGTQGYGLGLHAGHYPQCTSSDCRAIDFLSMAGISPWAHPFAELGVWVVLRAYPIRVAGNSGPMLGETSWEELGLPEEHTTVTKKVRRVGAWDAELAAAAVKANGGPFVHIALAMADQRFPQIAGCQTWDEIPALDFDDMNPATNSTRQEVANWLDEIERQTGASVYSIGTGPDSTIWLPTDARSRPRHQGWYTETGINDSWDSVADDADLNAAASGTCAG